MLMNTPVNDSVLHKYRCHTRHHIQSCFLGCLPSTAYAESGEGKILHMSKNQTPNSVKRNLLHLQKFEKFLCTLRAAVKRCHSSGCALPPPYTIAKGLGGNKSLLLSWKQQLCEIRLCQNDCHGKSWVSMTATGCQVR